ncbi:gamma-glutamylcyclotransferase family protein [Phyllobacterium zundukense]|uniref:Gamma-glutamylcyclotransferase n=1 Tax=Phyllobacterium zundukense TaxID=1867719 RepID=A0A2N9VVK9_9HYPH|nr:gamma-glutamylcyclotransferase family protein [Phyllobacterium zundukense]ATU91261.1 hypothetical protein BLM14_06165 [Phyllobacterium zundukense]PIO43527.1 hypothetical protein B5P45_16545 [Phyllobacterium zundukense]
MYDIETLAKNGELVAYFGYGSLVNRNTLRTNIVHAIPARLHGWRRLWRPRPDMPGFPAALLSVRREEGASVDGLLVFDHLDNLPAVDLREAHYHRRSVLLEHVETRTPLLDGCPLFVYEAQHDVPLHPEPPRILQSYLDAVMQGFLIEHGDAGLARFVQETHHFDTPIYKDRAAPAYPRAVSLNDRETSLFDRLLADRGALFIEVPRGGLSEVA